MQVTYGVTPISVPPDAQNTVITTYLWPGCQGEFVHSTQEFRAWALVGLDTWVARSDIVAPPVSCLGIESSKVMRWSTTTSQWTLFETNPPVWRLDQSIA